MRDGDRVLGYLAMCPQAGLRLNRMGIDALSADRGRITCSWHGAYVAIVTGVGVAGPCIGQRLDPWPVAIIDGRIVTA